MHLHKLEKDGEKQLTKEHLFHIMNADKAQGFPQGTARCTEKKEDK